MKDAIINPQKYVAELIGTFFLTFLVSISIINAETFPIATPIVAAFTLMICVYTIGSVSGSHINPAVTIGLLSRGKISIADAIAYIVAQLVGATLALYACVMFLQTTPSVGAGGSMDWSLLVAEMIGMIIFTFGISSVVEGKVPEAASGLVVGGSLLLGILAASQISNGVLNPAVALGLGSISAMYVAGPILGSITGFWLYRVLVCDKCCGSKCDSKSKKK